MLELAGISAMGSPAEWQEFSSRVAKPQDRFRDRVSSLVMTARGWEAYASFAGLNDAVWLIAAGVGSEA